MGNSEWAIMNEKSVSGGIATVKCESDFGLLLIQNNALTIRNKKMPVHMTGNTLFQLKVRII